jgi:hypothetical protein
MKPTYLALGLMLAACGCGGLNLNLINSSGHPVTQVEIKAADVTSLVPRIEPGASSQLKLSVKKAGGVSVNYQDAQGHKHYTSSPLGLEPGEGGSLNLSITAKGTLEAVRAK